MVNHYLLDSSLSRGVGEGFYKLLNQVYIEAF